MSQKFVEMELSPSKLFDLYLKGHGITYKWIGDNLEFSSTYISQICKEKYPLPDSIREKMNDLLNTNY